MTSTSCEPQVIRGLMAVRHMCECGKSFAKTSHLNRHKLIHDEKRFPCPWEDCKRHVEPFNRADLLRLTSASLGLNFCFCIHVCVYLADSLQTHIGYIHTETSAFNCTCGHNCNDRSSANKHLGTKKAKDMVRRDYVELRLPSSVRCFSQGVGLGA